MIIGISGPSASGKTTIAKMLAKRKGAFRIKYSDILGELAQDRGLDPNDKATLQNLFLTEREQRGEDFLTRELEHRVSLLDAPLIVIEGNRRLVDVDTLKRIAQEQDDMLLLLYIDASAEVRFERYNNRLKEHGEEPINRVTFEALEENGAESELVALREIFNREGVVIDASKLMPEEIYAEVLKHIPA